MMLKRAGKVSGKVAFSHYFEQYVEMKLQHEYKQLD